MHHHAFLHSFDRAAVVTLLLAAVIAGGCTPTVERMDAADSALEVAEALGGGPLPGFERALEPRTFLFPEDHGPHPSFRTEWWYVTGNLTAGSDRHFGFQVTFFRNGLDPAPAERSSAWAASQLYMAHFALTDTSGGKYHCFERFGRGAAGIAGARADPLRVWLEDWELSEVPASDHDASATGPATDLPGPPLPSLRLRASDGEIAVDLTLVPIKPLVFHGDRGLSRKGPQPGSASFYYSQTRLDTQGTVQSGDQLYTVSGLSWMDREWSTSVLEEGQVGWDWLSLQFSDGSDLMYFRLRRKDGSIDEASGGTWVESDGTYRPLAADAVVLEALETWTSSRTDITYPTAWRLRVASEGIDAQLDARLPDQEFSGSFAYWEGAVRGSTVVDDEDLELQGYVELTGYGGDAHAPPR